MIRAEKQILREEIKVLLRNFPGKTRASESIRASLRGWPVWRAARVIYGFAPLSSEPDWLGDAPVDGKVVAFPKAFGERIEFFIAPSLCRGQLGFDEPEAGEPAPPPHLVLVPGLAFDRAGGRQGRGGGYYDRWLAGAAPGAFLLGICFSCQLRDSLPREPHDRPVHAVLTELGFVFPSPGDMENRPAAGESPETPR